MDGTDTSNSWFLGHVGRLKRELPLRALLAVLGIASLLWLLAVAPQLRVTEPARDISARIMKDDRFKTGALAATLSRMNGVPSDQLFSPEFVRAKALLAVRAAEEGIQRKASDDADRDTASAIQSVKESLTLAPTDAFFWMMLYSIEIARSGFEYDKFRFLDASYSLGPREGWIVLRRNRIALSVFDLLTPSSRQAIIDEFASIVDADFIDDASVNLTTTGWASRDLLLHGLTSVDMREREALARKLASGGLKIAVPGVEREERPW